MKKAYILKSISIFCLLILSFNSLNAQGQNHNWWNNTTIYQIYIRSFQDSNADGIGDIKGIISRLDYLKSLGVETIWITPFFSSPQKDWGYDVSDYRNVSPDYGTLADVNQLIAEVHSRGMKLLFDMVLNHTSDQHPWFKESSSSKNNPKRDWYVWKPKRPITNYKSLVHPVNNWKNTTGVAAWNLSNTTGEYYYSAFLAFQPDLNLRNPEVIAELKNILRFWLDKGVDGFRFDLFSNLFEDKEFRSNPLSLSFSSIGPSKENPEKYFFQNQIYTLNQEDVIPFAQEIRAVIDEYPNRMGVTEAFAKPGYLKRIQKEGQGANVQKGVHQTMLLDFLNYFQFSKGYFENELQESIDNFSEEGTNMTHTTGNHDRKRAMDLLGRGEYDKAKMLALFQFTVSGNALMFQGEEIGMTLGGIPDFYSLDPTAKSILFNFRTTLVQSFSDIFIKGARILNRDNTRIPMQWDDNQKNAGFSTAAKTWLPVYGYRPSVFSIGSWFFTPNKVNVADQENDSNSMLSAYKEIIALRNTNEVIKYGNIKINQALKSYGSNVMGYERTKDGEIVLVLLNFSKDAVTIPINFSEVESTLYETKKNKLINKDGKISMAGLSGVVLKMKNTIPPVVGPENPVVIPPVEEEIKKETLKIKNNLVDNQITSRIILSPVPTNNVLFIKTVLEKDFISSVSIFDLTNKKIVENKFSGKSNTETMEVSSIISGKYVLSVTHSDGKVSREFFLKN